MFFYLRSLKLKSSQLVSSKSNHLFNESYNIFFSGKEKGLMGIISTGVGLRIFLNISRSLMKLKLIIIQKHFGQLRKSPVTSQKVRV